MPISKVFGKLYKVEKDGFYSTKDEIEISNKIKKRLIFLKKKWYLIQNIKKIKYNKTNSELDNKYEELKKLQRIRNTFISEYPINKIEWENNLENEIDLGLEYEDDITKEDINDIKSNYEKCPTEFIKKHNLSINKLKMYIRSILTNN